MRGHDMTTDIPFRPGLRVHRRIGESFVIFVKGKEDFVTTLILKFASGGKAVLEINEGNGPELEHMRVHEEIVFGDGEDECVIVLDSAAGSHASFRALAGPAVRIRRNEETR